MMNVLLDESFKVLDRAKDALQAARHDVNGGFILAAVNRAYYSMFYCANALLHLKNINVKTHNGVRNKFSETYIKKNLFPEIFAEKFGDAYNLRAEADYDMDARILPDEAIKMIQDAEDMLQATEKYLIDTRNEQRAEDS